MDAAKSPRSRSTETDASSISDVLLLIAAQHSDILGPTTERALGHAVIAFARGDLAAALDSVNDVLGALDIAQPAYDDVMAFRLFLVSMLDHAGGRWTPEVTDEEDEDGPAGASASRVVSLCVASNEFWYSGGMFQGLSTNHAAIRHSRLVAAPWRMYAGILLAKKLTDIRIVEQASRVIRDVQNLIDGFGLHVFESLPEALRSVLHLQSRRFDLALQSAAAAVHVAEQRGTVVGVNLALSVSAMAHLGLGEPEDAAAYVELFHAQPPDYGLPDSAARTAFVEVALAAGQDGPRVAAEQVRARWHLLATDSPCFVEDPARPAWLVSLARQAADSTLAERCLRAIERLARDNRGLALPEVAAGHARRAYTGERSELASALDFGAGPWRPAPPHATPPGVTTPRAATARGHPGPEPSPGPPRRPALSRREDEIARLVGSGLTNLQVAKHLGLSPHTVNFHLRSIFRKLSISTRVKLGRLVTDDEPTDAPTVAPATGPTTPAAPGGPAAPDPGLPISPEPAR